MINTLLVLLSLLTPRSFTMFETPINSLLSKATLFFYPSLASGFVPEFYVDPFDNEGYFLISKEINKVLFGTMAYASSYGLYSLVSIRRKANSLGFGINYSGELEGIDAFVISFSHRTSSFGYDAGVLVENKSTHDYISGYFRTFRNLGDQTDMIVGLRGISEEHKGLEGFAGLIFSPVSGQYIESFLGYSAWLRKFYVSFGMSHQFYRNFALSLGFYYPLMTFESTSLMSRSILEVPGVLPAHPDFRIGFDMQDNSSIYTLSLALDCSVVRDFLESGRFAPNTYAFRTAISVYFYSF